MVLALQGFVFISSMFDQNRNLHALPWPCLPVVWRLLLLQLQPVASFEEVSMKRDTASKQLKVTAFPQNSLYVPSVRIAGLWLNRFGFNCGDEVQVTAQPGKIIIEKTVITEKEE
jgi:hypothetical protein